MRVPAAADWFEVDLREIAPAWRDLRCLQAVCGPSHEGGVRRGSVAARCVDLAEGQPRRAGMPGRAGEFAVLVGSVGVRPPPRRSSVRFARFERKLGAAAERAGCSSAMSRGRRLRVGRS